MTNFAPLIAFSLPLGRADAQKRQTLVAPVAAEPTRNSNMVHSVPKNQGLRWLLDLRQSNYIGADGLEYYDDEVEARIIELSTILAERAVIEAGRIEWREARKNAATKSKKKTRKRWRSPNKNKVNKSGHAARKGA